MTSKAKYWLTKAKKEKFAIGAFNVGSLESLKAVVGAAVEMSSPVIVEASHGEIEHFGLLELVGVVRVMERSYGVPIILNLDHAPTFDDCQRAIEAGFDYVHFDGSKLDLKENIETAKKVVALAHKKDILVEGEMDSIGGSSADHRQDLVGYRKQMSGEIVKTDPAKAKEFVEETGIDTFASFVGNVHGLYPGPKRIDRELLKKISKVLPKAYLSLHGGSGIPEDDILYAIGCGIVKVNVNSELRVAFRDKLKETLMRNEPDEVAIYKIMPEAILAMKEIVKEKIRMFGSGGKI